DIQYRLNLRRRVGDGPQDLARRGLVLQRLGEVAVAFLQFFEQAHVLNGDHRLGCEGFKQFDLLVRERPHLQAADMNRPDGNSLAQQRCGQHRPNADPSSETRWKVTLWHCCQVIDVKGLPVNYSSGGYMVPDNWN